MEAAARRAGRLSYALFDAASTGDQAETTGCDVIPDTTAPPLLASRQPRDDLVVHCNDATGEMRVIGIGIAQGEDDLAVGVNADHA